MSTSEREQPEVLSSEEVYAGRLVRVFRDTVREGEKTYVREVVGHPGGAAVVPSFEDGTVAFVSQYRHPARRYVLELPAGKLDPGELPAETAARELEEELGVVAGRLEQLSEFYTTPGFCAERLWVFLATELRETERRHEEDEMVAAGEIDDAKTIIGLLLAASRLAARGRGAA